MQYSSFSMFVGIANGFFGKVLQQGWRRRLGCFALIFGLIFSPGLGFALAELPGIAASAATFSEASVKRVPALFKSLFGFSDTQAPPETPTDRIAQLRTIRISPSRFVGYSGESLTFQAIGKNFTDQTVQGVLFDNWESSDSLSVQIDDSGRARFLRAGLTTITCRAGAAVAIAQVLVRPGPRPRQTDQEWKVDQDTLPDPEAGGVGSILPSLLDKLAPTAYAQGGGYSGTDFGYDELWSESRNLVGSPRNRAIEPTGLGPVLPEGSNFNFAVPLIGLGARGIGANLTLYYNSRVWSRHGNAMTFSAVGGFPFGGFSVGFGRILTYGPSSSTKLVLVDPDGTRHYLGAGDAYTTATYQTTDGTHITFVGSAAYGGTLYYNDGTQLAVGLINNRLVIGSIKDSNGNFVSLGYKTGVSSPLAIDFATDSQGRKYQFNYNGSGDLVSITAPGYGGTAQNPVTQTVAQFDYQSRTLSYNFTGLTVENVPTGSVNVLRHIYFPGTSTGWLYSYSDYGMIYNVSSRRQMAIDGNGVISDGVESASVDFNYPSSGSTALTDAPVFSQRTESASGSPASTYNYSATTDPLAQTMTFTVSRPDASQLWMTRDTNASHLANGLVLQSGIYGAAAAILSYVNDSGGSVQVQSVTASNDLGQQTYLTFDYDQYGNITNKREYGFQIAGVWQVRRRTNFTYSADSNYTSRYLRSLVTDQKLYDALENTNDADDVLIAKTAYTLDDYAATGGMEGYSGAKPPGHDTNIYRETFTWRGNVTGVTQWIDLAAGTTLPTRLKKYDKFGNVLQEQVSCCKQKVFTYVANDYWAQAPTVTDGDLLGLHLTGSTTYDFNTGLAKYTEFANLGKRWFFYDAALRLIQQDLPTGGSETASYSDANMTASFTKPGLGTDTLTYDGFGRPIQAVDANNGQVNTTYGVMGKVASRTNPFAAGGTPGPSTGYTYDALGRVMIVTLPDGQTTQTAYSGSAVTMTDQVNRTIKRETDGLGRLVTVTEQDATGALTQVTNYSYNLLDRLTLVNEGNQTRAFGYDALGRMLYERIPEQTATINDGAGTYWTAKYTYTDFSAVATKTDARGVVSTHSYDQLNRLTSIVYNISNAPGVVSGAYQAFTYDNNNSSPTNGLLLSAGNESYGYDGSKRLASITRTIDSINYTTSYQYGTGSLRSKITYPSGRVVNINRSSTGRLTSLTDQYSANYLTGIGYNAAGQVTGLTLGNGVVETYGYDPNRLQLTSQTATKSGGPTNGLMNLTYYYQASAGQMGAGSTAGNAGQLMAINNNSTINGTTESTAYTFDNLGRLVTSNQTSNGSSAQRRFAYDRWGNRTGVWDAVNGGNQIQSVVLQQSGGAPTNQLQSVTTSGVTKNYTYDSAGNVTNDGQHTYAYDGENRLASVDGGATAQYSYDQNNRRYKKTIGTAVTHSVWEGSQVIAEHDGSTGVALVDYVFSGKRMIAMASSSAIQYFLSDRLSSRLVLDANGNVLGRQGHLPFGEDFGESGSQEKHHFTSYDRDDESGMDNAVNREYSAAVGRFLSADPYRASGYMIDPQSWNRYGYCRNNPVDFFDPNGLNLAAVNGGSLGSISVSAGDGWISSDSPGFALFWSYLTGGGGGSSGGNTSGSGEGTGPNGPTNPEPKDIGGKFSEDQQKRIKDIKDDVEKLLKNNKDCADYLGGEKKALALLGRAQVYNANTIDPKYAGTGGKFPGGARAAHKAALDPTSHNLAMSEIGARGVTASSIYVNARFFSDIGPSSQLTVFIHELSRLNGYKSKSGKDEYAAIMKACGTADPFGPKK
jgi:RHS repeat-associated protein